MISLSKQKRLVKEPVRLSKESKHAVQKFHALYKAGKVFLKNSCIVRREADVYLVACKLADTVGKDIARHIGAKPSAYTQYRIIFNVRVQFQVAVGPHTCAVGAYDFDNGVCTYEGLVSC